MYGGVKSPNCVVKTDKGYLVNEYLAHGDGFLRVSLIKQPKQLVKVPDSLNIFKTKVTRIIDYLNFIDKNEWDLMNDSLKSYGLSLDTNTYEFSKFSLYQQRYSEDVIHKFIDTIGIQSYASFYYEEKLLHLISDSSLSLKELDRDSLVLIYKLYDDNFWTYFTQSYHENNELNLSFDFDRNDEDLRWVFLRIFDKNIVRYNFIYKNYKKKYKK